MRRNARRNRATPYGADTHRSTHDNNCKHGSSQQQWTHLGCRRPPSHDRGVRSSSASPATRSPSSRERPSACSSVCWVDGEWGIKKPEKDTSAGLLSWKRNKREKSGTLLASPRPLLSFLASFLGRLPQLSPLSFHFLSAHCSWRRSGEENQSGKSLAESWGKQVSPLRCAARTGKVDWSPPAVWYNGVSERGGRPTGGGREGGRAGEEGGRTIVFRSVSSRRRWVRTATQVHIWKSRKQAPARMRFRNNGDWGQPARLSGLGLLYLPNRFTPPLQRHALSFPACASIPLWGVGEPLNGATGRWRSGRTGHGAVSATVIQPHSTSFSPSRESGGATANLRRKENDF